MKKKLIMNDILGYNFVDANCLVSIILIVFLVLSSEVSFLEYYWWEIIIDLDIDLSTNNLYATWFLYSQRWMSLDMVAAHNWTTHFMRDL